MLRDGSSRSQGRGRRRRCRSRSWCRLMRARQHHVFLILRIGDHRRTAQPLTTTMPIDVVRIARESERKAQPQVGLGPRRAAGRRSVPRARGRSRNRTARPACPLGGKRRFERAKVPLAEQDHRAGRDRALVRRKVAYSVVWTATPPRFSTRSERRTNSCPCSRLPRCSYAQLDQQKSKPSRSSGIAVHVDRTIVHALAEPCQHRKCRAR